MNSKYSKQWILRSAIRYQNIDPGSTASLEEGVQTPPAYTYSHAWELKEINDNDNAHWAEWLRNRRAQYKAFRSSARSLQSSWDRGYCSMLMSCMRRFHVFSTHCATMRRFYIGWFLRRFHLVILEPSWFPKKKTILLSKAKTKGYLWASFHDIWSWSKSSKLDIQKAISAKQIMIKKIFLC